MIGCSGITVQQECGQVTYLEGSHDHRDERLRMDSLTMGCSILHQVSSAAKRQHSHLTTY